jgi:redox-sensitive bicupin YhaK (pirin superfamily)
VNNLTPGYEQKYFSPGDKQGRLRLVASRGGDDESISINQDVSLYASLLASGETLQHELAPERHGWVQVISGGLEVNGERLEKGDGAAVSEEKLLSLKATENNTEFLLFDLN